MTISWAWILLGYRISEEVFMNVAKEMLSKKIDRRSTSPGDRTVTAKKAEARMKDTVKKQNGK
jgi:hypothetical protein